LTGTSCTALTDIIISAKRARSWKLETCALKLWCLPTSTPDSLILRMDHTVNKQECDTSESHQLPWQTPSLQDNQQTPLVCTYWHFLRIWTFWRFFDENTIDNRRSLYNFSGGLFVQWGRQIGDSREQTGLRYPGIATASRVEVVGSSRPRNKVCGILNKLTKPQCRTWSFWTWFRQKRKNEYETLKDNMRKVEEENVRNNEEQEAQILSQQIFDLKCTFSNSVKDIQYKK